MYGSPSETILIEGEFVTKDTQQAERLNQEYLTQQILQANRAHAITRISPVAILQHLFETFAGTGFNRHLQFLENAQRYAHSFRMFVAETDRRDPNSLHIVGVRDGMSKKSVSSEAVPKFEDTLSLTQDFNTIVKELLVLVLLVVILFSIAHFVFIGTEV